MAEMIPASISGSTTATRGEKHLFYLLQEALLPDEDFYVWYDQTVGNKHPDFIIYAQHMGLLIMEVKDWTLKQIHEATPEKFAVEINGNLQKCDNPLVQARKASLQLMDKMKTQPFLLHSDGPHKGQPHFPIGYAAAFTNIHREAGEKAGLLQIIPTIQCLFEDDLDFDPTDRTAQQEFRRRIKPCFNVSVQFNCAPLDHHQLQVLRHTIFPEVRIIDVRQPKAAASEQVIKVLDKEQEQIAKSIGPSHRILKGVAGSGKTLVVATRAKYLKQCHPNWRILVLCYNVSLSKYLKRLIELSGDSLDTSGIDVFHFLGLVKSIANIGLGRFDESFEDWEARITGSFLNALRSMAENGREQYGIRLGIYDAILIDEGQDFTSEMMQSVVQLLNGNTNSLLFCYDPSQNVFGRDTPRWKDAGLQVQGKKPIELKTSYRNTSEIAELATRFAKLEDHPQVSLESALFPKQVNRHGNRPVVRQFEDDKQICAYILDEIARCIRTKFCNWADIGVIYVNQREEFPLEFNDAFYRRFAFRSEGALYWVNQSPETRHNLDITSQTVKMCTIESSKGLEFKVVFLVGLDQMPRIWRDPDGERKLAYVGITRAQDILHIPYCNDSPYIVDLLELAPA